MSYRTRIFKNYASRKHSIVRNTSVKIKHSGSPKYSLSPFAFRAIESITHRDDGLPLYRFSKELIEVSRAVRCERKKRGHTVPLNEFPISKTSFRLRPPVF
jgi:hypothetical protein